jgi:MtN3 and saliva related transmembrane protein
MYDPAVDALGYVAAVFATGSFVPQVIKTWQTRSAEDLSYLMLVTHIIGMLLWLAYGVMIGATPVVVANTVAVLLDVALIVLKMRPPATAAAERHT